MDADTLESTRIKPFARNLPPVTDKASLPEPGDEYRAMGFAENSEVARIVLIMGREGFAPGGVAYYAFQYVHIGRGEFGFDGDGQWFRFGFSDLQPKRATVRGRNLLRMFDLVSLRRVPWIRMTDRDFRAIGGDNDNEPVVTTITVEDWVAEEKAAGNR
jgi:hypothetical protein